MHAASLMKDVTFSLSDIFVSDGRGSGHETQFSVGFGLAGSLKLWVGSGREI